MSTPALIQPTTEEIRAACKTTGYDFDYQRALMISASQTEADRLNAVAPGAWAEITKATQEAEAATARAEQALTERQSTISDLEAQALALGKFRVQIEQIRGAFAVDPEALAVSALDALCAHLESPCPRAESIYQSLQAQFVTSSLMLPHAQKRIAAMETRATATLAELRATAKRSKIDLGNLLALIRDEAAEIKGGRMRNVELHRLFSDGFLSVEDAK